ncbi:MAG: ABC transporter permease [Flavobacterium sp. 38-13]|uniref:ABC transporter permease n=1 Tax=Flavobacterium sp. 38-13 TaxID=1896168 RepID=UPI0009623B42|nr:ABC transporter permease [Flavobacterium sp. 38-13]OJX50928.1 MAG: ABC transporter permease [Flavobacterium sp. 38-13]
MVVYLRLLRESFGFALNALRNNKLRTILSLLGVTIGIFSIIAVLTAVDSLDRKIKSDMSTLDKNTMYLKRFPFGPSEVPRWKRDQYPNVTYEEYDYLKNAVNGMDKSTYQLFTKREIVKYDTKSVSDVNIVPATYEFVEIQPQKIKEGRFFNESESNSGTPVAIIGYEVANSLFGNMDPIGKKIRLYGQRFTVIGVLEKQGQGMFGENNDISAFIPVNFLRNKFGDHNDSMTPIIIIKPDPGVDVDAFKGEIIQKLRNKRGLKVGNEDNFFIDVLSGFTDFIDEIVGRMNLIGWIISFFSLLVGGFGVANIMFVSVKERTNLIGIQKSLGAKNKFILLQFLFEAIILCLIGGVVGLLMVWGIAAILTNTLDFEFVLGFKNIVIGTTLAALIGLVSGILPAVSASRLDPVEAIRTGM